MPNFRNDVHMLAVRLAADEKFADALYRLSHGNCECLDAPNMFLLQAAVRERIRANPNERWLLLAPVQTALTDSPPVTFAGV